MQLSFLATSYDEMTLHYELDEITFEITGDDHCEDHGDFDFQLEPENLRERATQAVSKLMNASLLADAYEPREDDTALLKVTFLDEVGCIGHRNMLLVREASVFSVR